MKKFKKILVLIMMITLVAGCGNKYKDNSPEGVALNMAERLSNGNYENIEELIYTEEDSFIDEESFKNYLNDNLLNIEGNEMLEVIETETSKEEETKSVEIRIDNSKILKINTIKKEDKWYVDLGNEFDANLIIKVPSGSTVKLNNKVLDRTKFSTSIEDEKRINSYEYVQNVDTYTIPYILKGKYDLVVENKEMLNINESIDSKKSYYTNSNSFYDTSEYYSVLSRTNENITKELKEYIEKYYKDIITYGKESKEFNTIEYFNQEIGDYTTLEGKYNEYKESYIDPLFTTWTTYYSDAKAEFSYDDNYYGGFYIKENNYIVTAKLKFTYTKTNKYNPTFYKDKEDEVETKTKEKNIVLEVVRKDGKLYIKDGLNIYPEFSMY